MSELDRLAKKYEKALLKLAETERQLEALTVKHEPLVQELDELREQIEALEEQIADLTEQRDQANRTASDALSLAERVETEAGDLRARLAEAERKSARAYAEGADDATREWDASHAKDMRLAEHIERLREELSKSTKTPAEQAVLDAMGTVEQETLEAWSDYPNPSYHRPARTELARRKAAPIDQPSTEERGAGGRKHVHPPAECTGAGGVQTRAARSCEDEDRDLEGEMLP